MDTIVLSGIKFPIGDLASWVAGVATVITLIVALLQIFLDRLSRQKKDTRKQAEQISAYIAKETMTRKTKIVLSNLSSEPAYEAIISIVAFQGAGISKDEFPNEYTSVLSVIPPGKSYVHVSGDYHGMSFHPAVEIAFKDVKGNYWLRNGRGDLNKIRKSPVNFYGFKLPLSWEIPKQEI